ncbi:MAG TPA: alpha/beta hydrolase [Solirubrobacteraceae bacterium]|jgi:pimeloyl-ACP methyl ester carboxylesterase|nr:alpha/beta hydrolase [Solirubrobacteraceae bacterium]
MTDGPQRNDEPASDRRIELVQGTIRYRDEGHGPAIVFVHGLLVDGRLWRNVLPTLRGSHRCIVPDLPLGAHRSALATGADRSPRGIAHLLADFLEALELDDVTIVANDTGGAISQILAAERPERVGALVLTNCDCFENFLPPVFRPLQWLAHVPGAYAAAGQMLRSARLRRSRLGFGMLTHRAIPDELTASWSAPLRDAAVRADVLATLKAIDSRDTIAAAAALAERPVPMLLAWAPDDRAFPIRLARRLAETVPGSQLLEIADSRAFVPEDQPVVLAEHVASFIASRRGADPLAGAEQLAGAPAPG